MSRRYKATPNYPPCGGYAPFSSDGNSSLPSQPGAKREYILPFILVQVRLAFTLSYSVQGLQIKIDILNIALIYVYPLCVQDKI